MDLSGVVDLLANVTLTVTRKGTRTLQASGFYTGSSSTSLTATGVVYPAEPEDVLLLPEGRRSERSVVFLSTVALQAPSAPAGAAGDQFTYQGERFDVLKVEPWQEHGFWRNIGVKVGQ